MAGQARPSAKERRRIASDAWASARPVALRRRLLLRGEQEVDEIHDSPQEGDHESVLDQDEGEANERPHQPSEVTDQGGDGPLPRAGRSDRTAA